MTRPGKDPTLQLATDILTELDRQERTTAIEYLQWRLTEQRKRHSQSALN